MKDVKDLTRQEIIKALRVCSAHGGSCKPCPLYENPPAKPVTCYADLGIRAAELLEGKVKTE